MVHLGNHPGVVLAAAPMVDSGLIRLPTAIDAKAREDFTFFVITTPPPSPEAAADQEAQP